VEAEGRDVLTVEGLGTPESLHPLQAAFIEHGALQCGFCTAGMLLTAKALLDEEPSPTPEQVAHYLRGSLCRCTGYRKIVDAILACAGKARGEHGAGQARGDRVGQSIEGRP
jgi:carbon-monoxide dehydrogenase small subunit